MSIIKDINELNLSLRSFLISLIFIIPFWFIDIFLFNKVFYLSYSFYISIVFSFCFTVGYYIPFAIMATYVVMVAVLTDKSAPKEDPEVGVITIASLNYIMYQALITALAYVFNMNFKSFLILYSSILFVLVIATVVYYIKKTEKVKQQE